MWWDASIITGYKAHVNDCQLMEFVAEHSTETPVDTDCFSGGEMFEGIVSLEKGASIEIWDLLDTSRIS